MHSGAFLISAYLLNNFQNKNMSRNSHIGGFRFTQRPQFFFSKKGFILCLGCIKEPTHCTWAPLWVNLVTPDREPPFSICQRMTSMALLMDKKGLLSAC